MDERSAWTPSAPGTAPVHCRGGARGGNWRNHWTLNPATRCRCRMLSNVQWLERTFDLEPDRTDLDGEDPKALVQEADAMFNLLFDRQRGAQDRD